MAQRMVPLLRLVPPARPLCRTNLSTRLICTSSNRLGVRSQRADSRCHFTHTGYTSRSLHQSRDTRQAGSVALVGTQEPSVSLQLDDGTSYPFSPLLLRDLCTCPHCVNPSSRQKNFSTTEIPPDVKFGSVSVTDSTINITWKNDISTWPEDHSTEISIDDLKTLATANTLESDLPQQKVLWDAATYSKEVPDIEYDAYMSDDSILHKVLQRLHSHGLVFLVNVPEDTKSVSTLAERIAPLKNTFYGQTWDVRSVPKAINVAYTSGHLGFHMDLLYMQQPPHLQLLHCIRASSAGGASLFTDSFRAAAELRRHSPDSYRTLTELPVNFHYDHPESQYYHQARRVIELRQQTLHSKSSGHNPVTSDAAAEIAAVSWSPPFQGPFTGAPYAPIHGEQTGDPLQKWHAAACKFNALVERADGIHERMMQPGVCVIFDNRRILHARKAFAEGDVGKERWLRGAYIDEDPYLSKLKVLNDRFGNYDSK